MGEVDAAVIIRSEEPADRDAIAAVVQAAFGSEAEARLVDAIRASENFVPELSVVAVSGDRVVGHVMVSHVGLHDGPTVRSVASLSPLAVAPDLHGRGIGGALVRAVVARSEELGEPMVVLEGAPAYYGRFGFEPAGPLGLAYEPVPPELPHFQIRRLSRYSPNLQGTFVYCWEA